MLCRQSNSSSLSNPDVSLIQTLDLNKVPRKWANSKQGQQEQVTKPVELWTIALLCKCQVGDSAEQSQRSQGRDVFEGQGCLKNGATWQSCQKTLDHAES